jgi:hypothetical protein
MGVIADNSPRVHVSMQTREYVFGCKPTGQSFVQQAVAIVLLGALMGAVGWYQCDGVVSFGRISIWMLASIVVFALLAPLLLRNPVIAIGVGPGGLRIERARRSLRFAWGELEAARLQVYQVPNLHTSVRCLLLRARGENFELTPDFDEAIERQFIEAIEDELETRGIPAQSPGLPTFERVLSQVGAWLFIFSIFAMLIAHAMGYRTLGTVFGLGLLFTGSAVAVMTIRQRLSKLVLAATIMLIVGGSIILWACKVNVRDVLNRWEWQERSSGRFETNVV